jgi:hypothetical protein
MEMLRTAGHTKAAYIEERRNRNPPPKAKISIGGWNAAIGAQMPHIRSKRIVCSPVNWTHHTPATGPKRVQFGHHLSNGGVRASLRRLSIICSNHFECARQKNYSRRSCPAQLANCRRRDRRQPCYSVRCLLYRPKSVLARGAPPSRLPILLG